MRYVSEKSTSNMKNGKQLQVTPTKITESKENKSIHRLDLSGSTGPEGASVPLASLAPPPLPPPPASSCGSVTVNCLRSVRFVTPIYSRESIRIYEKQTKLLVGQVDQGDKPKSKTFCNFTITLLSVMFRNDSL